MRSIRTRLAITFGLLMLTAMAALGTMLIRTESARFRRDVDDRLLAEARLAAEAVAPEVRGGSLESMQALTGRLAAVAGARMTVIAPDGTVLGDSDLDPRTMENHAGRPEVQQALAGGSGASTRRSASEDVDFRYVAVVIRDRGEVLGVCRLATTTEAIEANLRRIAGTVVLAAAGSAVAGLAAATLLAGAITRPLLRLRDAVRGLTDHGFEPPPAPVSTPGGGGSEVEDLAAAFDTMSDRLNATFVSLSEERSRLQALLASSTDLLLVLDKFGIIRYLNPAAERQIGAAVGRSLLEATRSHELNDLVRALPRAQDTDYGAPAARQSSTLSLDGGEHWLLATVSPVRGGGGWATLVILHDVTEVRRAEVARRDFVANVSHELRTPLAGIKAIVETLQDGAMDDPPAAADFLTRVDAEVDRLVQLVEELLQLARIESGTELTLGEVSVEYLLNAAAERFRPMAERNNIALTLDVAANLPALQADERRLGQAVGNLIHNALKFTPAGGAVRVRAEAGSGAVRVEVTDTGEGILPDDLPRIFERFYMADRARSSRGAGLGLAIVKHVTRAHGGNVDVVSTPGEGATFTITLPVAG